MPLHTPSAWTFWLSVVLVVLAIIATFVSIPYISMYAFWVAVIGYVILVIGCTVKTA
jgi:heme/copper-type cytochrome/quinol oxidase subunit 1